MNQFNNRLGFLLVLFGITSSIFGCNKTEKSKSINKSNNMTVNPNQETDTAYLAAGCFWCIEAIFQQLDGVISVTSGYTAGSLKNPTYKEVCSGTTGHAEAARIVFDPSKISFDELLEVFWKTHDPTTLNRQGADVGSQYRSGIYYTSENQNVIASKYKTELNVSGAYDKPIVTEIIPFDGVFYEAEDYHQNYYNQNGEQGYCRMVIQPKVEKFKKVFPDKLKK
jgi:peptide-methionine (S)-S-oxide reductase